MFLLKSAEIPLESVKYWKINPFRSFKNGKVYAFAYKMFLCDGKMFLKKRQNLLTREKNLLKSIYHVKNTFVFNIRTKERRI